MFRRAWETLNQRLSPRKGDMTYLRILKLAARGMETDVAATLEDLLVSKNTWDDQTVAKRVEPVQSVIPTLETSVVNLAEYDQLLNQEACYGTD